MKAIYLAHPGGFNEEALEQVLSVPGIEFTVDRDWKGLDPEALADRIRQFDILLLSRAPGLSDSLGSNPGNLKWICYLHGGIKGKIGLPIMESGIQVTNWGDHTGVELSEGALVFLYCCLKDVHHRIMETRRDRPRTEKIRSVGGTMRGLRVGVYGYGFSGRAFVDLILPLGAEVTIFDPYAEHLPEGCKRADSLEDLFDDIQAVVIQAALTPETEKSITKELLAKLPDHGIVVNTARGAIIDQDALFAELKTGRLRAGLDVLNPDHLPEGHEARKWENLIYGGHCFSEYDGWPGESQLTRRDVNVINNLKRYAAGEPLKDTISVAKYKLMT